MFELLTALSAMAFILPMENFIEFFYNGTAILTAGILTGCVEFGTTNGQEILIYSIAEDGRKYARYSCSFAGIYGQKIITHIYGASGIVYQSDYNTICKDIEENHPEIIAKYRIDTIVSEAENAIEQAEQSLDDPNCYGILFAYNNYVYNIGKYHGLLETLDILDSRKWFELTRKYNNKTDELGKRADVLYRNLRDLQK